MSLHAFLVLSEVEFRLIGRFFSIGGKRLRIRSGCGMIKLWQSSFPELMFIKK